MKLKNFHIFFILPFFVWFVQDFQEPIKPKHFPKPVYSIEDEPGIKEKIKLGKILFYDPILSLDGSISCASCHSPYQAFAHTDHALSHGIFDSIGTRNAPALFNLAWQKNLMWDGAVNHIEVQALAPISDKREMAENIGHVIQKLQQSTKYKSLFFNAFQDSTIQSQHVLLALAKFQLSLISAQSKYDQVILGQDSFTVQEKNGYDIFKKHCNTCHTEPLFSNFSYANNGLPMDSKLNDLGRFKITQQNQDSFCFKIPSLRNLSYTYPYMHDGRFKKLYEVINHYNKGIQKYSNLAPELKEGILLNEHDKIDLIAFLLTLNDHQFVRNPEHQYSE